MLKTVLLCTQHILIVLDSSSACALVLTRDCSNATILFLILVTIAITLTFFYLTIQIMILPWYIAIATYYGVCIGGFW